RAPEIAAQHSRVGAWSIARVSDRPRRPEQAADDRQRAALAKFSDTALADQALTEWLADERGDSSFVYYRPIRIGGLCLSCHGTPDQLAAGVAERLAEVYPGDQATGYAVGELRGMFVVAMAWPAARAEAERLVQASRDTTGTAR
ncbi:MAG TPA: DUF3365 domain-containing protein, partial [candidate division Zixibacteria bacterium]|nr:DUF3365 domain-containing protein [candidate division Zixibacteria bacterium]